MSYLNADSVSRIVHLTSAAATSMDQTHHKILKSVKSNSVPRGSWSRSSTTGVGPSHRSEQSLDYCSSASPLFPLLVPIRQGVGTRSIPGALVSSDLFNRQESDSRSSSEMVEKWTPNPY